MKVFVFAQSRKPFIALLQQEGIDFQEPALPVGVPMASGTHVEIPLAVAGVVHQLAKVLMTYLKARQSRKVIITTKEEGVFNFQAEGLSQSELERTLRLAHSLAIIETRDDDVESRAAHPEVKD